MKKTLFFLAMVAMTFGTIGNTNAQDTNNRESRRAEMQARQTERLVKDLKLTDEQKPTFEATYKKYLEEMAATRTRTDRQNERSNRDKELTEEEATAQLKDLFTRQAEQIQQQQQRLDIQRKYCAELSSILTPQQLLRVFQTSQANRMAGQGRQGGSRGGFGGQGGPRGGGFGGQGGFGGEF